MLGAAPVPDQCPFDVRFRIELSIFVVGVDRVHVAEGGRRRALVPVFLSFGEARLVVVELLRWRGGIGEFGLSMARQKRGIEGVEWLLPLFAEQIQWGFFGQQGSEPGLGLSWSSFVQRELGEKPSDEDHQGKE